jgi:hypothetical protein
LKNFKGLPVFKRTRRQQKTSLHGNVELYDDGKNLEGKKRKSRRKEEKGNRAWVGGTVGEIQTMPGSEWGKGGGGGRHRGGGGSMVRVEGECAEGHE